jgi:serine/threonine-protein kinase
MGSKEGRLVSVDISGATPIQRAEPLKAIAGSGGCASSGSSGSACGGAPPAIAIYGTPAAATDIPLGVNADKTIRIGNVVIIAGYNGKVIGYDSGSLQQIWQYPPDTNLAPIISAVTVVNTTVYFAGTDGIVYALDAARGGKIQQSIAFGEIWATPVVDNNLLFIGSFDKNIYALDATTLEKKWQFTTGANNVAPALVVDGVVYVGSLDRNFYALDETTGKELWHFTANNWFWSKAIALNGVIYAPCLDNNVYAFDPKTGDLKATYNVEGQVASWPTIAGNQVVVATKNGKLWGLPAPAQGVSPAAFNITLPDNVVAPLGSDGEVVYINGPDNKLYGFNVTSGQSINPVSLASQ